MTTREIAYVGTYLPESLRAGHDWSSYSPAGQTKQQSTINALFRDDCQVDVVSNVIPTDSGMGRVPKRVAEDNDTKVHIPPNVDVIPRDGPRQLLVILEIVQFKFVLPLFATLYLCFLAQRRDFDAIVFYNFNIITAFPALIAGVLFGVPIIIEFNDFRLDSQDILDRIRDRIYLYVVGPWIAGGICINTNMASLLQTDNTIVVRGEPTIIRSDMNGETSDSEGPLTIFYGGKLDDVRGIDFLLDAAPEIIRDRNVQIRITGYGPRLEEVRRRVTEMGEDQVSFLGYVSSDRYREELLSADIALNLQRPDAPGNEYTFPTKILDYLATGNVVVSTRMSDLEEVLCDILVFTEPSSIDVAATVGSVCDNLSAHSEREDSGVVWVREVCSSESRVSEISGLLDDVCS
jgi:glycosyltransferase involved in cell wall biosynthesis